MAGTSASTSTSTSPDSTTAVNVLISLHVFLILAITAYFIYKIVDCVLQRKRRSVERSSAYRRFRQPTPSTAGDLTPSPTIYGENTPTITRFRTVTPVLPSIHSETHSRRDINSPYHNNSIQSSPPTPAFQPAVPQPDQGSDLFYSTVPLRMQEASSIPPTQRVGPTLHAPGATHTGRQVVSPPQAISVDRGPASPRIEIGTIPGSSYAKVNISASRDSRYCDVIRTVMGSDANLAESDDELEDIGQRPPAVYPDRPQPKRSRPDRPPPTSPPPTSPPPTSPPGRPTNKPKFAFQPKRAQLADAPPRPQHPPKELKRYQKNGMSYTFVDIETKSKSMSDLTMAGVNSGQEDEAQESQRPAKARNAVAGQSRDQRKSFKIVKPAPGAYENTIANLNNNSNSDIDSLAPENSGSEFTMSLFTQQRATSMYQVTMCDNPDYGKAMFFSHGDADDSPYPSCRASKRNRERRLTLYDEVAPIESDDS